MRFFRTSVCVFTTLVTVVSFSFPQTAASTGLNSTTVLEYLNRTINWYRQLDLQRQAAIDPDEGVILNNNQKIANQAVALAFEFARTAAESIEKQEPQTESGGGAGASGLRMRQRLAVLEQQIQANGKELGSLRQKLAGTTGRQRESIETRIAETKSELELAQARKDAMTRMAAFVGGTTANGLGATGIRQTIEGLARSVPQALEKSVAKGGANPPATETPVYPAGSVRRSDPTGVWALASDLIALSGRIRTIRNAADMTDSLNQKSKELRTPLVNTLRELSKRGDELGAAQSDTTDQIVLVQQKAIFDALTAQFTGTSNLVLPLSQQGILLDLYRKNLTNWQDSLETRYGNELRNLLARAGVLVILLSAVFVGAELWRRAILGYVRDPRRRYQYLLLRKIVFWFVIAIVLVFSFANELSSAATFAGLITAGVAVALQNVILSIVGYFFLIGKYGIRVGDRVQVAGITGEVVDIGLVRFHTLELIPGGEKTPSGRIVAFSNSIVFQSNAGFFKQIPGTNFVWHEIALSVPSESDYRFAEEKLRGVVGAIFSEYRDEMERQYRHMERTLTSAPAGALQPASRLRLAPSGLEVLIRYPVDLTRSSEIDDRVTREILQVIDSEPKLKSAGLGKSSIRLKTDV